MGQMVVRKIPDDVLARFKAVAKEEGKSAEQLAREAIEKMAGAKRSKIIAEIKKIRASTTGAEPIDIVAEIRKDRKRNVFNRGGG